MLFNSLEFLIFFPIVTITYYLLPHRFRWILLLLASCMFYMAFIPEYILILAMTIAIDYYAGIRIESSSGKHRQSWLIFSIFSTCLVLFIFKYWNFFCNIYNSLAFSLHFNHPIHMVSIVLPIGLSFHTFQSLAYVIEVYRGNYKAERNFGIYSLYVMFYPQLVAGPIERPQNLLHQFKEYHSFNQENVVDGLLLILWGLFKKVVIADRAAIAVNHVYTDLANFDGVSIAVATVLFSFQIYCDFSGYSDIALGTAQVMGFKLMRNFNRPYYSRSISEFWKRWHISLSTWFKDYLYISLGGNRVSRLRWNFNLMITFVVSGLWHGANWTFIFWGALNGAYLVTSNFTRKLRERLVTGLQLHKFETLVRIWQVCCTFALITFAWVFFRAQSLSDAFMVVRKIASIPTSALSFSHLKSSIYNVGLSKMEMKYLLVAIGFMECIQIFDQRYDFIPIFNKLPRGIQFGMAYLLILFVVFFGVFGKTSFIYFQF